MPPEYIFNILIKQNQLKIVLCAKILNFIKYFLIFWFYSRIIHINEINNRCFSTFVIMFILINLCKFLSITIFCF